MHTPTGKVSGYVCLMIVQIIFLALFWLFVRYEKSALPAPLVYATAQGDGSANEHVSKYPQFQDIQVMIFIGFGFLMTFLRKYGYSATGYTLFMSALVVQWSILMKGFLHMEAGKISLSLESIIDADIAAAVPLISMGALLGRTTPIQLLCMSIFEIALFAANEYLALNILSICDCGGSITVHAFGAYFGLAVALMLRPASDQNEAGKHEGANYTSDIFAMIGTTFLWVYWPSFNSVLADGAGGERAILNTFLSLAAATVTTFVVSALVSHDNKLDMVHVQNSTLAGGVAVGTVCNLLLGAHGAVLIGIIAGTISVLGYRYLTPWMTSSLRLHDTCGVHNLHGMPALVSAIASAVVASLVTLENYQSDLQDIFPAMVGSNSTDTKIMGGLGRNASTQAGYQLFGIALTLVIAIGGGILTGAVLKYVNFRNLQKDEQHQDEQYWEVPAVENKEE
ncbi:LOW QUALITY PROTEIN: ammonium transporter Rh type B [Drosophila grimshawi]|uniref:LOW QUALITY PROTEIN: ammonium transporter Rh type B n=1 Tax=Drosophila grimshawi TaxID=7222 RepID=UPI001C9370EE|nr:LOW QUALITY PROTEIN: ammonium transporter Rh type B [Drosophila grimshawi]